MRADIHDLGVVAPFAPAPEEPEERPRFALRRADALAPRTSDAWLVKHVLPASGWGLVYGASRAGKTFLALDVLAAVATGSPWNGRRVARGAGLYVALEGAADAEHRVIAVRRERDMSPATPLYIATESLALADAADIDALETSITDAAIAEPIRLIVIDTLARASTGLDENDAGDMGVVVAAAERLARTFDCLVLLVHHSPWDAKRPRGSSALYGAADVILKVEGDGGMRTVSLEKLKMGRDGEAWCFELEQRELAIDDDGEAITSCVAAWRDQAAATSRVKLSPKEKIAHRALLKTLDAHGFEGVGHSGERVTATTRERWRDQALRDGVSTSDVPRNRRDGAARVERSLIAKQVVACRDQAVWLCDRATDRDQGATVAPGEGAP